MSLWGPSVIFMGMPQIRLYPYCLGNTNFNEDDASIVWLSLLEVHIKMLVLCGYHC